MKDEVFLCLNLLKVENLANPTWSINMMVIHLNSKTVGAHFELA